MTEDQDGPKTDDKLSTPAETRIPLAANRIQVNFCKNPKCTNFGVPASNESQPKGRITTSNKKIDTYIVVAGHSGKEHMLRCRLCGEYPTTKSNLGISEELERCWGYLIPQVISCPDSECPNHKIDVRDVHNQRITTYLVHGKTAAGTQRYKCKLCDATFSAPSRPTLRHRRADKNSQVFTLLVNKVPLRRICEVADISMAVLYDKIDFIHEQCLAFAASQESKLPRMHLKRLYLCSDRQDYMINWTIAQDKRNVELWAIGTADLKTSFVFGTHVNYDPLLNPDEVEADALTIRDYDLRGPFRKYGRLWLREDYVEALIRTRKERSSKSRILENEIEQTYNDAAAREDIEAPEAMTELLQLPVKGMQVREEYALYGHFFFLRKLLGSVEKVRFFLDQDSGIRAACLSAFCDRIKNDRCDAFYVRINKDLTVNARRKCLERNQEMIKEVALHNPGMKDWQIRLMLLKRNIGNAKTFGKWQDRWVTHPFPNMSEPEKAMCHLTDMHGYDEDHLAWLYNKASLHAIDRFFMQVRRRLCLLERPLSTSSNPGRRWHGYNPYNPAMVGKVLDIFRVFYNYVQPGKDDRTPAMRLELTEKKVDFEKIISFL